ncbi:MAG TPA: chorismate-binding protein, partial [Actinomycetota bacterium]
MSGGMALRSRTLQLDGPVDLLEALPTHRGIVWIHEGTGFVAWGEAVRLDPGSGAGRFARAAEAASSLLGEIEQEEGEGGPGPLVFGSFTFLRDAPGSWLVLPAVVLRWTAEGAWLTVTARDGTTTVRDGGTLLQQVSDPGDPRWATPASPDPVRVGTASPDQTREGTGNGAGPARPPEAQGCHQGWEALERRPKSDAEWMAAVASARRSIREGRLLKVVLARDVVVDAAGEHAPFDARAIARRLAGWYPQCWTFACEGLVGASPELLVRREGSTLHSLTLAGSARRGDDPAADEQA